MYNLPGLIRQDQEAGAASSKRAVWKAIVRSAQGAAHQRTYPYCHHASQYRISNPMLVGAIASGLETASYGDLGSKLALEEILDELLIQVRSEVGQFQKPVPPRRFRTKQAATQSFTAMVRQVQEKLQVHASSNEYEVDHLACHLLAFIATPCWLIAFQIGGGLLVVRSSEGQYQVLFPDSEVKSIERLPITHPQAVSTLRVCVYTQPLSFLCAATHNLSSVALQPPDRTPFAPFFQPLEDYMRETPVPEEDASYLLEFLNSDPLQTRVSGGRTLLLGSYQTLPQ